MIFLMLSTLRSQRYTVPSAASLLSKTTLRAGDRFIIVDNDGTLSEIPGATMFNRWDFRAILHDPSAPDRATSQEGENAIAS